MAEKKLDATLTVNFRFLLDTDSRTTAIETRAIAAQLEALVEDMLNNFPHTELPMHEAPIYSTSFKEITQ